MGAAAPIPRDVAEPATEPDLLLDLARFLDRVEDEAARAAGAFVLQRDAEEPALERRALGTVMVERGRLCWATADDSSCRLSLLIARETGLGLDELREHFALCRAAGRPFGEYVVEQGLVAADTLRRLLLEQVAHALGTLLRECHRSHCRWSALLRADTPSYQPRFTFGSGEVVAAVLHHDVEFRIAQPPVPEPFLALLSEETVRGACLQRLENDPEAVLPVALSRGVELSLGEARELLAANRHVLDRPLLDTRTCRPHLAFFRCGEGGTVVARWGDHCLVAEVEDTADFATLVAGLRRQRAAEAP